MHLIYNNPLKILNKFFKLNLNLTNIEPKIYYQVIWNAQLNKWIFRTFNLLEPKFQNTENMLKQNKYGNYYK